MASMPQIPYIVEGEILSVQERKQPEKSMIRYTVLIELPSGADMILFNVKEASSFGGIADYERRRARGRADGDKFDDSVVSSAASNASVGERVYIACIGGNPFDAIIVGYKQHPNQTEEIEDASKTDLFYVWQLQGVRKTVDETGQFRIIHKGAPQVKYVKEQLLPNLAPGSSSAPGDDNPAIEPVSEDNLSAFEMLDGGIVNIRDYSGNLFQIDPSVQKIEIKNNSPLEFYDLKKPDSITSASASSGIEAESIMITGDSDQKIDIQARKDIKLETAEGAVLSLSGAKVALGTSSSELLSLVIDLLDQNIELIKAALDPANQNVGNLGFPTTVAPAKQTAFQQISQQYEKIKQSIEEIKGSI